MVSGERLIRLILFDIDGTLLKSSSSTQRVAIGHAIATVFGRDDRLLDLVPDGKVDSQIFLEILAHRGIAERVVRQRLDKLFSARSQYLVRNAPDRLAEALPGVHRLLLALKERFLLGLATGNEEQFAWYRLKKAGLQDFFIAGGFGSDSERRADVVKIAIERTERVAGHRFPPSSTLLVGDTPHDVLSAKENSLPVVAVATGRYGLQELRAAGADIVLPDLTSVSEFEDSVMNLGAR